MAIDRSVLARALGALRERAVFGGDGLVITDPWTVLDRVELPRECLALLVQYRCLVSIPTQRGRFRIVRETPPVDDASALPPVAPPPTRDDPIPSAPATPPPMTIAEPPRAPRFLLILDAENVSLTHRDAGIPFRPAAIRDLAGGVGSIAFAFAYGNIEALPARTREDLTLAGFPLVHCQRLRDGNGGKDTVDEHIQDLIHRFLDSDAVDGVILVSDDRNFAPIMREALDRGKRVVRVTLRGEAMLDQIGEVRRLPSGNGNGHAPEPARRWAPELIIEDLRTLPQAEDFGQVLRRIRLRAPLVSQFLRAFVRRYWMQCGATWSMHFQRLVEFADSVVRDEDRSDVSPDDVRSLLSTLDEIGVVRLVNVPSRRDAERTFRAYLPNWGHPFCADAISDIKSHPGSWRPARRRDNYEAGGGADRATPQATSAPPHSVGRPKARHVVCRADGFIYRVHGARTRDDALTAVRSHYTARSADDGVLATIAAIGSPPRGTTTVDLDVTGVLLEELPTAFDLPQGGDAVTKDD